MHSATDDLLSDITGLFAGETDPVANAANAAAAIFQHVPRINWAGFYFLGQGELVLGTFQGRPAFSSRDQYRAATGLPQPKR